MLTVLPLTMLLLADYMIAVRFGDHRLLPERARVEELRALMGTMGLPVEKPGLMHLWFLYYLCYFYLLIPLCVFLSKSRPGVDARLGALLRSPAALVILGLWTAATLWPFHAAHLVGDLVLLNPHLPSLAY
jgi:peptidoglycan/LPS O-acetylase OafA/YrhL